MSCEANGHSKSNFKIKTVPQNVLYSLIGTGHIEEICGWKHYKKYFLQKDTDIYSIFFYKIDLVCLLNTDVKTLQNEVLELSTTLFK